MIENVANARNILYKIFLHKTEKFSKDFDNKVSQLYSALL